MIPNIYHFVMGLIPQEKPFHLTHYLCLASCLQVNRPDQIIVHVHHEPWGPLWDLIRSRIEVAMIPDDWLTDTFHYEDKFVENFSYAHRADFIRLRILLKHGGTYADLDTLFIRPHPEEFRNHSCVMGLERLDESVIAAKNAGGSLCNALIMAEPGSAFIRYWLEAMPSAFDGSWSRHSTFLPYELSRNFPSLIHVVPESVFFPLDWTPKGLQDLFEGYRPLSEESCSIHLWAHLWWDEARRDFSSFCANKLTSSYVKKGESTYARLASPHLPDISSRKAFLNDRIWNWKSFLRKNKFFSPFFQKFFR